MKTKLIPAALIAAMLGTPAMACTDWRAVAAFDATLYAQAVAEEIHDKECRNSWEAWWNSWTNAGSVREVTRCGTMSDFEKTLQRKYAANNDREHALADKCQEETK